MENRLLSLREAERIATDMRTLLSSRILDDIIANIAKQKKHPDDLDFAAAGEKLGKELVRQLCHASKET